MLVRINKRAKQIRNAHPKMEWKTAQQKASKELKSGKAATGSKATKKAASRKPVVTRSAATGGSTITSMKSGLMAAYQKKYGELMGRKLAARTKPEIKRITKEMAAIAAEMRKVSK